MGRGSPSTRPCLPSRSGQGSRRVRLPLQADALDFLVEASNYAVSLFAVGLTLRYRSMAAFAKGATMGVFGLWVLGVTTWHAWK